MNECRERQTETERETRDQGAPARGGGGSRGVHLLLWLCRDRERPTEQQRQCVCLVNSAASVKFLGQNPGFCVVRVLSKEECESSVAAMFEEINLLRERKLGYC